MQCSTARNFSSRFTTSRTPELSVNIWYHRHPRFYRANAWHLNRTKRFIREFQLEIRKTKKNDTYIMLRQGHVENSSEKGSRIRPCVCLLWRQNLSCSLVAVVGCSWFVATASWTLAAYRRQQPFWARRPAPSGSRFAKPSARDLPGARDSKPPFPQRLSLPSFRAKVGYFSRTNEEGGEIAMEKRDDANL